MKKTIPLFLAAVFCLTGCWDKIELENRGFVVSMGIDKYSEIFPSGKSASPPDFLPVPSEIFPSGKSAASDESASDFLTVPKEEKEKSNRYTVSLALPNVASLASKSGGGDEENKSVKKAGHRTISGAMGVIDSHSSQTLYYGQTKIAVFGLELLEDEGLFREAVDALERNPEISRKLLLMATEDSAEKVVSAKPAGEPLVGLFVSNYYQNKKPASFQMDLESLAESLGRDGTGMLPKIQIEDKEIKLGGAAVIKDFKLAGWLNAEQTRGVLWMKGEGARTQVTAPFEENFLALLVSKNKARMHFSTKEDGGILCTVDIQVEGVIEEFTFTQKSAFKEFTFTQESALKEFEFTKDSLPLDALCRAYEEVIEGEIREALRLLQDEWDVDGFGIGRRLQQIGYEPDSEHTSLRMLTVEPQIKVKIHGTGSVLLD